MNSFMRKADQFSIQKGLYTLQFRFKYLFISNRKAHKEFFYKREAKEKTYSDFLNLIFSRLQRRIYSRFSVIDLSFPGQRFDIIPIRSILYALTLPE